MRIIAGEFRGRRLGAPKGTGTRPTTDRVREALFSSLTSILGPDLGGVSVLDAFAGSGALGIEALSRGASTATFVEHDRAATSVLRANIDTLGLQARAKVSSVDMFSLAGRSVPGSPFALILLDPPYTLDCSKVGGMLAGLAEMRSVVPGALVTWEHARGVEPQWPAGFELRTRKQYGSTEIDIAVYEEGTQAS